MNIDFLSHLVTRVFFFGAFCLLALATVEVVVNFFNYTVLPGPYTKGRLVEGAVVLLVFVICVLLRQIRDALRAKG